MTKHFYAKQIVQVFIFCLSALLINAQTTVFNYTGSLQTYTVPAGVTSISIEARGAQGGSSTIALGGRGAVMKGDFVVTPGQVIRVLVGQQAPTIASGSFVGGGGGGGTFVVNQSNNQPLVVAGGGGGAAGQCCGVVHGGVNAVVTINGTDGINQSGGTGAGGVNGNGGGAATQGQNSGAGGGFFTDGANGAGGATGGKAYVNSGAGGLNAGSNNGGYGGGGGSHFGAGGGGGGYSGGGATGGGGQWGGGGGGGSINNGSNQINTPGGNAGNGSVTITVLTTPAGALNFVKSNNTYITVPHSASLDLGAEFTIEAWVNYTGVNSTIIDKGNYNYLLQVNCNNPGFAPNRLDFYNRNTGWVHSIGTVPEGVWTHVAVTLKNGTMTFYINGVASGTAAVTFAQDGGPVNIGRQSPSSCACNIFNGNMDELRVWNRALSSCEINANKACELTGAQTGLAAYYKFNQGNVNTNNSAVNTLTDASGNNNTGALINFALTGTTANWVAGQVSGTCVAYVAPNASITGNLVVCSGATTQLSNAIAGGVWNSSNNAVATVNASGLVTGVSAGTTTITYTNNCGGVSTATVTVNASPAANISAVGSTTLCAGSAITLNANTGAGLSYQWRLNGNPISGATNANYITNAVGSYTVVTTQSGCSTTSNAVAISADQTPPVAVCKDVNLVLNASGTASIVIPATTSTLLYEDWSGDNQGYYANTSTLNWNVTGDIDRADYVSGMPGIEIDLSGFANGAIETKQTFNFTPGTYTISFLQVANTLAGNAVKVDIGSLFSQTFVTGLTISSESATFTVTSNTSATVKLTQLGTSDPSGSFVGQIRLVRNEAATLAIENGSTDNCSIASITASKTDFTCADIGENTVTLTVTDVNGNVATCQATVTVTDNTAPVMSAAPSNITLNATSAAGALINYTTPTASDNCPVTVSLTSGLASGSIFPIGTTTVTYRATDASGNSALSSFTVTVIGVAPQIVSPGNQTAPAAQGTCGAVVNFTATETTGIPASTITYSHQPGSVFPVGVTTVTATATNVVGTSQVTFTITVNDVTPPSITCASNITVNAPSNACAANVTVTSPVVSDNCSGTPNYAEIAAPFNANATNLSLWIDATKFSTNNGGGLNGVMNDASGKRSVSTTATYETAGFNGRPSVRYNNNQTATSAFSTNANTYVFTTVQIVAPTNNWASVFYHLNRDGGLTIEQNPFSPNAAPSGTAQYHFQTGNDNTNVERNITYGVHYIMAAKITGGNVRSFTLYRDNNGVLQNLGTSTNSAFTLSIGNGGLFIGRSDIGSEFTNMRMGEFIYFQNAMPSGVTEASVIDYLYQKWLYNNSVSLTNSFNGSSNASGTYPVGTTNVIWTATDANGNTSTCQQTVTVVDNTAPQFTSCPSNITVNATSVAGAVVNYSAPVGTDNCSGVITALTSGLTSGATFPIGTTTVTYRATDASGNTADCSFTVTVSGNAPVIICPPNITVNSAANQCGANVNFAATETTGIPASVITYSHAPGSFFPVGTTTITATATNAVGTTSCTFTVTVRDITPPVLACTNQSSSSPVNFMRGTSVGGTAAIVAWAGLNGASQYAGSSLGSSCNESWRPFGTLCDEAPNTNSMTISTKTNANSGITFNTGGVNSIGAFVVDLGATQTFNLAQVYQMFSDGKTTHVRGFYHPSNATTAPSITDAGWVEMFPETLVGPGVLSGNNVTQPTEITFNSTSARYVRFYVRNDGRYGNGTWIETRSIKLFSTAPAVNNVIVTAADGECNAVATYNVEAIDNCSGTVVTYSIPSGSSFPIGTTPVEVTATDASGNTTTCSFSVIVNAPEINVTGNGNSIPTGATATSAANNTNFGGTLPNTSVSKSFVVQNTGTAALKINSIGLSGLDASAFSVTGITLPATIAPNANLNFNVVFNSNTPGIKNATITINNSDCNEAAYQFAITAEITCTNPVFVNLNPQVQANTTTTTCNAVVNYPLSVNGIPTPGLNYTFSGATTGSGSGTGTGQTFNLGTTHVIVTAMNPCSTVVYEFDVIVSDITAPTVIAQNLSVNLNTNGTATITAAQVNNGSNDNCGIASIAIDKTSFNCSNVGANTVTLTVTDVNGNSSTATATVTIVDNTPPSITAPTNIVIPAGANCSATGINLGTPVTADNCAVQSVTNNAPAVFALGVTSITWIATDASGNTTTAIQNVTVVDQTAPVPVVATLPDITGECSVTVTAIPKATDNCNGQITATTTSPLIYSAQGTYTITWRYTDLAGNSSTQTQTVIVKDITPPVINCPAPITTTAPSNQCGVVVNYPQPTTSDNCGSGNAGLQTLTYGAQFFDYADNRLENQYSPGLPMTFAPTDGQKLAVFLVNCGSTHFMYQNVTLPSGGPITLGFDMKYTNHNGGGFSSSQFIAVELRNPVNNALIATLFKTNPGAPQSTGMIRYTYDLSAYAGQQVRLQIIDATINNFFIDVLLDNITIPGSSLVNGSFETGNYNGWTIGSSNTGCGTFGIGSGPSLSVVQKAGLPSGSTFPIGTTTNTFEVTDLAGNKSTCSFNVTVNAPEISISGNGNEIVIGDNTPSTSDNTDLGGTIPGNSISKTFVIANNGTSALTVSSININNAAFTRSGISLPTTIQPGQSASFTISFVSGTLGVQTAIVTVNNSDCNEGTYNFTVKAEVTCTNPVFTNVNSLVEANTTTISCNTIVQYPLAITGIPTPNLNYVFSGATTGTGNGTGSGNLFNKGTTHVIVTAVNPCSTVIHEFDIVVSDITPPITIAQNLTIHLNASGTANITPAQVNNGSTDNCGIATITLDKTAFDCSNVGANTVTLTVTDVNGNSNTATAVVTVVDNIAPTAVAQNLTIPLNASGTATITAAQVNNGSSDNCSIATITLDKTSFDCSNVGANTVTLTVTDVNGNSSTATAVVTVVDNIAPTAVAQNLTIPLNASGTATITAAQVNNGSSDNCSIATITLDKTSFDCSNVGANTVTLTVTDVNGNSSTATAVVTVVDNIAPTITAPANINQGTDAGVCGATVHLGTPITADNCSIATVTNNAPTQFPVGTTVVTWTVTDVNGNSSIATQTIIVTDTEKPRITAPAMVTVVNTPGTCTAPANLGTPVISDNCGVASVTNNAPALFPVGTTVVIWTVKDIHGNVTDTATQLVVVIDNELPTISVTGISVNNDAGKCGATISIPMPITADNCGVASIMGVRSDHQLLTKDYPVGTTTISWTVRDVNGNMKTITQTIQVNDNEKPTITCTTNQVFCANTGGNTLYTIAALNQSDNCGIASTTYNIAGATNRNGTGTNASGSFAIGTSTVTFTVTDIHGNISTCSFTVTIRPLPVASISTASPDAFCNQFVLTANSTLSGPFTYQWLYNNNTKATTQKLSLGLSDADGIYSVYTTDANGCRSELPATYNYQKQNLVSSYTILGTKKVKLGQYNKVETGSVGVMSSKGEADFDKYSSVTGAGSFVKAPRIDTDKGVTITSKIYGVANVNLPTMQYNLSNTRYLQDKTVNSNTTATVSGNYDEVTLKKGSNVTLTGTVFGKIKLEEGASVRFTSTTIDVEEIQIEKGPKTGGYSYIRFAPNTSVRVSKKVTIGSDVIVNPEAYQVTFYMGDNKRDEEKFHVKGDDTRITANIILPDGKLKVTGGNYGDDKCDHRAHSSKDCKHKSHGHHDCDHRAHGDRDCRDDVFMTGLFIAEEVESEGKNVIWNSYNCSAPSVPVTAVTANHSQATVVEEAASFKLQAANRVEEDLKVTVMPNPTRTYFTLKLESKYDAPVMLRVMDASGRVVDSKAQLGSNSTVQIGHAYQTGNYFAEFTQGNRRKVIQLIKMR